MKKLSIKNIESSKILSHQEQQSVVGGAIPCGMQCFLDDVYIGKACPMLPDPEEQYRCKCQLVRC
ncbi:hypothetical protein [Alistipes sp. ZOR0009]|jgi:hypothetical protein|uniref:hypothetical protein n=1 Tax=Alistipes sp. ZOR0009 TaxID=1339253 RepID=UPI000646F687|nr:hypothetical protein [Alistipes sp. ZOR0009]